MKLINLNSYPLVRKPEVKMKEQTLTGFGKLAKILKLDVELQGSELPKKGDLEELYIPLKFLFICLEAACQVCYYTKNGKCPRCGSTGQRLQTWLDKEAV